MVLKVVYIYPGLIKIRVMKNATLTITLILIGTLTLMAQDKVQDRDQERLMLVDGDVLQIRDQDQIRLQDPITLKDGTVVNPDGSYTTREGDRLRLQEGECLDGDGIKYSNEYQYRYKVKQENEGLSDAQLQDRNQNRYQVMLIDGEAFQIRNREQYSIQSPVNLGDGLIVDPDGTYQNAQRKQLRLKEGEGLNMDGAMFNNMYQHRKMLVQKNMKVNKNLMHKKVQKKPSVQKKKKISN